MKGTRPMLAALLAASLAAVPAAASTKGVTIAGSGFLPQSITIAPGESVTWTNTDGVAHQVAFDKAACNLVIQAGAQASCTFPQAGSFAYRDPSQRGSFRGTVTVSASQSSLTLATAKQIVVFGAQSTLSGTLATQAAGEKITVGAQPFGTTAFAPAGSTATLTGGAYSYAVKPAITTTYQATWSGGSSPTVKVEVRPRVVLAVVDARRGRFAARVSTRQALVGRTVDFQRRTPFGQWVTLKRVTLTSKLSATTAGAQFRVSLPGGASVVRVVMGKTQVGAGYLPGWSPNRTVRR